MRRQFLTAAGAAALFLAGCGSAMAFSKCHNNLSATGDREHSMRAAMASAKEHWVDKTEDKYGHRFADWWYSGDRTISCKWDASGTHFWCTATARPCAPVR